MPTPPPPSTGPAAVSGGGRGSLVSRVGGPRNAAILAAGGTVALVALLSMARGKSAANGTTTTITGDTAFDSGPYDMWNQWQEEYEDLQQQINSQQAGTTTTTGPGTPPPKSTLPAPIPKPPIPTPAPKPKPKPPAPHLPKLHTVTVKHGDTLSGIAAKNHISMATLKKLNPVYWKKAKYKQGNRIWAGDKVRV